MATPEEAATVGAARNNTRPGLRDVAIVSYRAQSPLVAPYVHAFSENLQMRMNYYFRDGQFRPGCLCLALAATFGYSLLAQPALSQQLTQPSSVRPASLSDDSYYGYYYGDEEEEYYANDVDEAEPSPSDAQPEPEAEHDSHASPPAFDEYGGSRAAGPRASRNSCYTGMCSCCEPSCYLFGPAQPFEMMPGDLGGFKAGGWTQIGYHSNETPLSQARNDQLAFNDHGGRLNLHQQWLWLEKSLSGDPSYWDWGFRADIMYGTDGPKTQAFGGDGWDSDPSFDRGGGYGWALPQVYGEVGIGEFSLKMGHFYTLMGHEVVTAPDNFFYSHALTMFNSEPFTHTGVLATYGLTPDLEVYGGWTAGWDTGFESENGGSNFLGGSSYTYSDMLTLTHIVAAGDFGRVGGRSANDGYAHSIVADMMLTERLSYIFQTDFKVIDETKDEDFGINQYLIYELNECWAAGTRMEWWKDDGDSHYALTSGVNYRPHANFILRPEVRYDWNPGDYDGDTVFGMDAILTY